jgi:hypothetical protein
MPADVPGTWTFVVRLWFEGAVGDAGEWRGDVRHVPTGRSAAFRRLAGLGAVVEALLVEVGRGGGVEGGLPDDGGTGRGPGGETA